MTQQDLNINRRQAGYQPWQIPKDVPLWQQGLNVLFKPFELAQEYAFTPLVAALSQPAYFFDLPARKQAQIRQEGLGAFMPGGAAREAYQEWEAPKYVKGAAEFAPWLLTGGIGALGVAGRLGGLATKAGRAAPLVRGAAKAVEYSPLGLMEKGIGKAGEQIRKAIIKPTEFFSAPTNEAIEAVITKSDWQRRMAQWFGRKPVLAGIAERIGGKAATITSGQAVEEVTARALLIGARVQEILLNSRAAGLANLRTIHPNPIKLFGVDEATGLSKIIKPKSGKPPLHINDIAEHPLKYNLTAPQTAYIKEIHRIEDLVLGRLKQEGVDVKLLKFDEFSHWVHREVIGKNIDDALVKIRKSAGRIGGKAGFEKTRFYETAAQGVKEGGLIYEPNLEKVLDIYVQTAAKRIADQRIAQGIAQFGVKPLARAQAIAPETLRAARETAYTLTGANQLVKVINRAIRGEKLTEVTLMAQEKRFPELGRRLRESVSKKVPTKTDLKDLLADAKVTQTVAKAPYWKAKSERVALMERARTPTLGTEATIQHPAFQGKIYPKSVAGEIHRYWDDMGFKPLNKLATISSEMRTLVAAADFSAPWIQGVSGMARHPKAWAGGVTHMFRSAKNATIHQKFLVENADVAFQYNRYGGYLGGFELMEAMPQLQKTFGMITKITTGKRAIGEVAVRQTYGRFEAAFGAFGDYFRLNAFKGMKYKAKTEQEMFELTRHIDRLSGVMSSKGLGIGKTQRDFETAFLFFAPRYTRAGFALIGDVFKGGLSGAEARKSLGSMMAAGAALYAGTAMALGQEPDFDPSSGRFMTIEIEDPLTGTTRHFGIGGMMTSFVRFGADVVASSLSIGMNEPQDFVKLSRFDNPFMKFMFSKSAPLTGTITGMLEQKNYFGEPFENPSDYAQFLAQRVIPIAFQQMFEEGDFSPTALVAEEAGLRTFPRSDWEKRDNLRDEIAQKTYGMAWEDVRTRMGELAQRQLENASPELQNITETAMESSEKMARGEGKVWVEWKVDGRNIEEYYRKSVTTASREFSAMGDGTTFKEKVDEANAIRRAMYGEREKDPKYKTIYAYFNEPMSQELLDKMNPMDLARRAYYQMMFSPEMYDQYGNYNFEKAESLRTRFTEKQLDYIDDFTGARWDEPLELQKLRQARQTLKPYWAIENDVYSQYPPEIRDLARQARIAARGGAIEEKRFLLSLPEGQAQSVLYARRLIALLRKQKKMQSPQIAEALQMFYRY